MQEITKTTDQTYFPIPPDMGDFVVFYNLEKDADDELSYAALRGCPRIEKPTRQLHLRCSTCVHPCTSTEKPNKVKLS